MNKEVAFVVAAAGIVCTIWFLTIGGIVQAINSFQATPIHATGAAVGIVRFLLTSLAIWLSIVVAALIAGIFD